MNDLDRELNALEPRDYVFVIARSSGKNIGASYEEAGYSQSAWYHPSAKSHREYLSDLAMRVKLQRSQDARAAIDKLGVKIVNTLKELLESDDESIRLGAVKTGIPYILKKEAEASEEGALSQWARMMTQSNDEDETNLAWGDASSAAHAKHDNDNGDQMTEGSE
jgi:hypothetical protein